MKLKLNLNRGAQKLQDKRSQTKRGHILLVDDEQENLDGLEALLRSEGYEVSATTSPQEALELVERHPIDLIISDQRMPVMLGTEMLSTIKARRDDQVRVILTGHTDMNDLITCINNGLLYRYLVKPWSAEVLMSVVEEGMKKIKIDRATKRFVPNTLWRRLYADRLEETTSGEGRELSCAALVIALVDFNPISQHLSPSEVFLLLSELASELEPHIQAHRGYLSHCLGDGFVAIFDQDHNAEGGDVQRGDVHDAFEATQGLCELLRAFNQRLELAHPNLLQGGSISLGIGAHVGRALLGTVGTKEHLEVTLLSDMIKVAIDVEEVAKELLKAGESTEVSSRAGSCLSVGTLDFVERLTGSAQGSAQLHALGERALPSRREPLELFLLNAPTHQTSDPTQEEQR